LLFEYAENSVGQDLSPADLVSDDLGCAESVSMLLRKVINFPIITGTWTMWDRLRSDTRFISVSADPAVGDIIISPTGSGTGTIRGHVGVLGKDNIIMSASSANGKWERNYSLERWNEWYVGIGGFPIYYFRLI